MKKYTILFIIALAMFFTAGTVFAQPVPPTGPFGPGPIGPGPAGPQGPQHFGGFTGPQGTAGQYGFPGQLQNVSVTQAQTYGHKAPILITGNLVQFYGGKDLYLFRDSSGEIIVKIGPKEWEYLWYQGISIDPSDTIEIYGEVHWPKHNWGTPEVHARFIRKK